MTQGPPKESLWNPNIQALRGLSIVLVLISHFFDKPGQFGAFGVGIFFCISGYLISGILIREFNETGRISISKFYQRRARRLLPLAYLVIILVVLVAGLVQFFPSAFMQIGTSSSYGGFRHYLLSAIFSIFYLGNLFGYAHLGFSDLAVALGHFWTLAVEEQFYFFWPLMLWLLLKKWNRYLSAFCIAGVVVTPAIHYIFSLGHKSTWTLPTSYLDLFFLGALFTIHRERIRRVVKPIFLVLIGVVFASAIVLFGIHQEDFSSQGYIIFTITEVLLFLGFLNWQLFGQIKVLRKLGDLSYSLYCIHWPVIVLFHDINMNSVLKKFLTFGLSLGLAALSTKYFETIFWRPRYLEIPSKRK